IISPPERSSDGSRGERARRTRWVMSEEQILEALTSLAQLVVLGHMSERKANVLRGIYTTMLQHLSRVRSGGASVTETPELREQLRQNPDLANILAPLLSPEVIDELLRGE
ncbi:MAG TPA: hypothetical protein VHB77_15645, partial [Planctomycetaceae bacterium]|nr:hypothetical protein [Planctomycetaceae bacterium]